MARSGRQSRRSICGARPTYENVDEESGKGGYHRVESDGWVFRARCCEVFRIRHCGLFISIDLEDSIVRSHRP
jgi:hypothetical protein